MIFRSAAVMFLRFTAPRQKNTVCRKSNRRFDSAGSAPPGNSVIFETDGCEAEKYRLSQK